MSKKGGNGGFWDDLFNKPFGGLFDFNGDGKEDLGEQWIAYKMFEEATKEDDTHLDGFDGFVSDSDSEDYSWRQFCEDGSEFGVDPEDYETEEEYEEALEEAKHGWRDTADDGSAYGIDPENYETEEEYEEALEEAKHGWRDTADDGSAYGIDPEDYETEEEYEEAIENAGMGSSKSRMSVSLSAEMTDDEEIKESDYPNKRRFNAAATLANHYLIYSNEEYEKQEKSRCRFILEQGDTLIAANYLTADGDFLFSQAIKDNFSLPVTLPDEDETSEFYLPDILHKIEKKNVQLALSVWNWCIEQFLPYIDYAPSCRASMTDYIIDDLYHFSDEFRKSLMDFLDKHADFRTYIIRESEEMPNGLAELIVGMIRGGYINTAEAMFDDGLFRAHGGWRQINHLMNGLIQFAKDNEEELETMEFVESHFLSKVKSFSDGMIQDEIDGWEKEISEYKQQVERYSEKYAFSRGNAWRNHVPDGSEYGLDPCDYDTEEDYLSAIQKEKYAWREWCGHKDTLGLDPSQFETEEEYNAAWQIRYDEQQERRQEQLRQRQLLQEKHEKELAERLRQQQQHEAELMADKTIYTYCGVKLPFSGRPYSFRTDDDSLKIGDTVIVPVGEENKEMEGIIVSIGQYARIGVPFPVEKTKFIIRRIIAADEN